ncbi:hypothetical protein PIIN_05641 [Serendipita indica DSM 11827]|uniref:ER membrane protein complex subunit 3 n=1 Tax=Serendipita indica (strain DSM 11827) TaxID=1109443 RepID=G4TK66_SERID|nr:hypothetical protein PIIN_05641 [Serendipita indica DSM 11827]
MAGDSLYLDPQIRDWVLFPITLVMILVGVLRHNIVQLIASSPKKLSRAATREQRALLRAQILRSTAKSSPIPPSYYDSHTDELTAAFKAGNYLSKPVELDQDGKPIAPNPTSMLTDPAAMEGMMGGMKNQAVMMIPQMIIMGWINFFFQGFVLIKLPFPLTLGFKSMMQRGIETPDMDVRWVSSLSWFFLNWFGLNGLYRVLLGNDNSAVNQQDLASSPFAGAAAPAMGQPQDYNKLFTAESENLQLAQGVYHWVGEDIDTRILRRYGKLAA